MTIRALLHAAILAGSICLTPARAVVLFDNGSISASQSNTRATDAQRGYDNFSLSGDAVVTNISWAQFDNVADTYSTTRLTIFSGTPESGSLASFDLVANRTVNAQGIIFDSWQGYDYSLSGLNLPLSAGTYWIGLNSNNFDSSWAESDGTGNAIPGSLLFNGSFPLGSNLGFEHSFRLEGTAVPEPSTCAIVIGLGALGLAIRMRRAKSNA